MSPLSRPGARLALAAALALGAAARLPTLSAPLLEGAAGKQTHLAMVARNLYRGRCTWTRPIVDDIGRPGYFVKEIPAFPLAVAAAYEALGGPREWAGRALAAAGWLAAAPLVASLAARLGGGLAPAAAALFFVLSPLALVYSRGFLNDPWAVAASILALHLGLRWREAPSPARAAACGLATSLALLLKPHVAFWLGPALGVLAFAPGPIPRRERGLLASCGAAAIALAAPWYVHAWAVHRAYPTGGAMVASGWVDPALWLEPELYRVVLGHALWMVLTPAGALLAALGAAARPPHRARREPLEIALLFWGAGVLLQCVALATRMLDRPARGSEYYELALVPAAAVWVGLGLERMRERLSGRPIARWAIPGALAAAMLLSGARSTLEALRPPERYRGLLAGCASVRAATRPDDEIAVLSDRPGTVLYYCDRRGITLVPAGGPLAQRLDPRSDPEGTWRVGRALARARYLYLPFPDLVERTPGLAAEPARSWRPSRAVPHGIRLYERRRRGRP